MALSLLEKINIAFGVIYACDKCGALFMSKSCAEKHESKCKVK